MKRGQIWVETVIYTLIALVMIGLVLSYVRPRVEELQDKSLIEQSIALIKDIDSTLLTMGGTGNQRLIELGIKKGSLKIDGVNDELFFEIESKYTYSEPGIPIEHGVVIINTEKRGKFNRVTLLRNYSLVYNITYDGEDKSKTLNKASLPYKLSILNKGGSPPVIDFSIK